VRLVRKTLLKRRDLLETAFRRLHGALRYCCWVGARLVSLSPTVIAQTTAPNGRGDTNIS
jgi:hypothetical protein